MNYYLNVLRNYASFNGRASRKEYWMFFLFNVIFAIIAMVLDSMLGSTFKIDTMNGSLNLPYGYIYLLYVLVLLLPGLAVAVRRLHDIGKSGWNLLIALIPLVGPIWILVLLATSGNQGENDYGPDPMAEAEAAFAG